MKKTITINANLIIISIFTLIFIGILIFSCNAAFSQSATQLLRIKAYNVNTTDYADEAVIYFDSNATLGYDPMYDAFKLLNTDPNLPNIYTVSENNKLAINCLPMIGKTEIILPLEIKVNTKGDYEVNFSEIKNFASDVEIYLIDNDKNITQNIKNKTVYTFSIKPTAADGRFQIKFTHSISTSILKNKTQKSPFIIWSNSNMLNITLVHSPQTTVHSLNIYNLAGQCILNDKKLSEGTYKFELEKGIYIVKLSDENKVATQKIYIK